MNDNAQIIARDLDNASAELVIDALRQYIPSLHVQWSESSTFKTQIHLWVNENVNDSCVNKARGFVVGWLVAKAG